MLLAFNMPQKNHISKSAQSPRRRPVSCYFCRIRKLRCSRQFPCSNCVTRGISCQLWPSSDPRKDKDEPLPSHSDIHERVRRLEATVASLQQTQLPEAESDIVTEAGIQPRSAFFNLSISGNAQRITTDALWLEGVFLRQSLELDFPGKITFRICPLQQIIKSNTCLSFNGSNSVGTDRPTTCIWLPPYEESKVLLEKFISEVVPVHHVVHVPSLRQLVDDIYVVLRRQVAVDTGKILLLLSIITSTTFYWDSHDLPGNLFLTPLETRSQAAIWIRATLELLAHYRWNIPASIECVQAIITTSIVLCNLEAVSPRFHHLLSMGITMARELSLHQLDREPTTIVADLPRPNQIQMEVGRRVWWHLVSVDWMFARFTGPQEGVYVINPRQMVVKKPENINDEDLTDGTAPKGKPPSELTTMSYFLQRLRLAEITRQFTDRTQLYASELDAKCYRYVLDTDAELKLFIKEMPSFFSLEEGPSEDLAHICHQHSSDIIIQRYLLNTVTQSHRCKLHLPYLVRSSTEPALEYSRQACLKAAKRLLYAERQLSKEQIPFASIRFKFTGIVYAMFVASIALGLDFCLSRGTGREQTTSEEVREAARVLEDAKSQSILAARLPDLLKQIFRQHKMCQSEASQSEPNHRQAAAGWQNVSDTVQITREPSVQPAGKTYPDRPSTDAATFNGRLVDTGDILRSLEAGIDLDDVDWVGIFRDLDQSFM